MRVLRETSPHSLSLAHPVKSERGIISRFNRVHAARSPRLKQDPGAKNEVMVKPAPVVRYRLDAEDSIAKDIVVAPNTPAVDVTTASRGSNRKRRPGRIARAAAVATVGLAALTLRQTPGEVSAQQPPGIVTPTGTPTPSPDIGGRGFTLEQGRRMNWRDGSGSVETFYQVLRLGQSGPTVSPPLGPDATSYTDILPTNDPLSCYDLIAYGGNPPVPLARSDLLCIIPSTKSPTGAPEVFSLRLDQSTRATLVVSSSASGIEGYLLVWFNDAGMQWKMLPPGSAITTVDTNGKPTIFLATPWKGGGGTGWGEALAAFPGMSSNLGGASTNETPTATATKTSTPLASGTPSPTGTATRTPSPSETRTPTGTPESQFYAPSSFFDGIEFRPSKAVSSAAAVGKAISNLQMLTAVEPQMRARMVTNQFGGYRIFGRNQRLTDLPEFAYLKGQPSPLPGRLWDDILGATSFGPGGVSAMREDLLLDFPGLGIWEQSNPLLIYGFTPQQSAEWTNLYNLAVSRGFLSGTSIIMANPNEFWAGCASDWFGYPYYFSLSDLQYSLPEAIPFLRARFGPPSPLAKDIHIAPNAQGTLRSFAHVIFESEKS